MIGADLKAAGFTVVRTHVVKLTGKLGSALDAAIGHAPRTWLVWAVALLGLLMVGAALSEVADGAAIARSTAWLRSGVLRQILGLGTRQSLRFPAGELASRLSANADDAGRVAPQVVQFCAGLLCAVGALVALALIDFRLCLTFLAGMPLLLWALHSFAGRASGIAQRYFDFCGATRQISELRVGHALHLRVNFVNAQVPWVKF